MSRPPTSAELLDGALGHQAPHLSDEICALLTGDQVAQLAHAIDRRVYAATKHHDETVAAHLDEAAERIRAQYAVALAQG